MTQAGKERDFGPKPVMQWIDVDLIDVDHSYQRTMEGKRSLALIERMLANFRWPAFGALLVAPTKSDGILNRYAVMDGQHRLAAAKKLRIAEVPCIIIRADSIAEQAAAFLAANRDRTIVNPYALQRAMLVAGNDDAMAINAACRAAGVEIPAYPIPANLLKVNQTLAIGAVRRIIEADGVSAATDALKVLRGAFIKEVGGLRAHHILGVNAALRFGAAPEEITRKLAKLGVKGFDKAIAERVFKAGGTKSAAVIWLVTDRSDIAAPKEAAPERIAMPKKQAPRTLKSEGKPSPFQAKPGDPRDKEIADFVAKKGVTKCPSAYAAPTDGGKAEYKAPTVVPDTPKGPNQFTKRAARLAEFMRNAGHK